MSALIASRAMQCGHISEFHGLNFRAILAVLEGSPHAVDYLDMAEAAARSPYERAMIAENRAAYDLLCGNPIEAAERCLVALDHICQTEGLWNNLIIALYRLGEVETVDATLRSFMRLDPECSKRLVGLLSSEPDLQEVRARPAFKELLRGRTIGSLVNNKLNGRRKGKRMSHHSTGQHHVSLNGG